MENYQIEHIEAIQNYMLGGKADFIINDVSNDTHINFQVRKDATDEDKFFIKFKSIDWTYIGMIKTKKISYEDAIYSMPFFIPCWHNKSKKNLTKDQIEKAEIFSNLIKYIYYIELLPENLTFLYTGVCSVCGRKLTDPEYIKIGIGPVCLENNSKL